MIVINFIDKYVRGQISDRIADYRFSNPIVLDYINEGRREIVRNHPEARYVNEIVVGPMTDVSETEDIGLTEDFNLALSYFVCHRILGEDSEHSANRELSTWHLKAFERAMA